MIKNLLPIVSGLFVISLVAAVVLVLRFNYSNDLSVKFANTLNSSDLTAKAIDFRKLVGEGCKTGEAIVFDGVSWSCAGVAPGNGSGFFGLPQTGSNGSNGTNGSNGSGGNNGTNGANGSTTSTVTIVNNNGIPIGTGTFTDLNNYLSAAAFDASTGDLNFSRTGLASLTANLDGRYITASSSETLTNKHGNISMWTNNSGYLTASSITNKVNTSRAINTTSPLQGGGALTSDITISMPQASALVSGYLSQADWVRFDAATGGAGSMGSQNSNNVNITGGTISGTTISGNISMFTNNAGYLSSETDPIFTASPANGITGTNISNWNTAFSWGNHALAGYLTSYTETDPSLPAAGAAGNLLQSNGSVWQSWTPNYLTSFTETDPVFTASPANGITGTNISNWNTAFGWGNHALAGYLTTEIDGIVGNEVTNVTANQGLVRSGAGTTISPYTLGINFATNCSGANQKVLYDGTTGAWSCGTETDPVFTASAANGITGTNISNWNTAFGWGDHALAGYLTSEVDGIIGNEVTNATTSQGLLRSGAGTTISPYTLGINFATNCSGAGQKLLYNGTTGTWSCGTETDPVFIASPASGITGTNISNWNAAFSWGNHALAGYLTIEVDPRLPASGAAGNLLQSDGSVWQSWTPNYLTSFTETDPVFGASPANGITGTNISNWNTAFGWGDHALAGYLTAEVDGVIGNEVTNITANQGLLRSGAGTTISPYTLGVDFASNCTGAGQKVLYNGTTGIWSCATETDPVFGASPANGITGTNISNWNTAFGWGNHALAGYLTAEVDGVIGNEVTNITANQGLVRSGAGTTISPYTLGINFATNCSGANQKVLYDGTTGAWSCGTETDPVFTASAANGISGADISNWNTAFGWGNHALAGYLTSEVDGIVGNEVTNVTTNQGLLRSGSGTTISPYTLGINFATNCSGAGQKLLYNGITGTWSCGTETDPVFGASPANGISGTDISNWNTAFGWGDHSLAGYLTTEVDGVIGNEVTNITANQGLLRSGSGTTISPYTLGVNFATNCSGAGQKLLYNGTTGAWSCGTDNDSGTVTSVGLSMPSIFGVSGSPVTTSGTLTATLNTQTANTIFSGPASGGAVAPTFRTLVDNDIPDTITASNYSLTSHNHSLDSLSNVTITSNTAGELLKWNGSAWINNTLAEVGVEPAITAGTVAQYFRGDKTFQTLDTTVVPEGTNLYYTDTRARAAISETVTGLDYNNLTGVLSLTSGFVIPTTAQQSAWHNQNTDTGTDGTAFTVGDGTTTFTINTSATNDAIVINGGAFNTNLVFTQAAGSSKTITFPDVTGTVWTSGNDGTGSTLDADLIDGLDSSVFLTSEVDGIIGNEVTNATTNQGLLRSGSGTTISPYTLGVNFATNCSGAGQKLLYNGTTGTWSCGTDNDSGTVTSVGLSMPSIFGVSGSPVTTSGTLTATLNTQTANTIFGGPSSGGAATPTFRGLVDDDIPDTITASNYSLTSHNHSLDSLSNVTITSNTAGELLKWNGSAWINNTLAEVGVEPAITAGTVAQYFRGDKTFQTLDTTVVPEGTNLYYTDTRARAAISETVTGLDYNNVTGVLSLTSGFVIPTTAEQSAWHAQNTDTGTNGTNFTIGDGSTTFTIDTSATNDTIVIAGGSFNTNLVFTQAAGSTKSITFPDATGTVWTSGNDGTGSTLDADLLDGLSAAAFTLQQVTTNGATTSTAVALNGGATFPGSGIWNSSGNVGIGTATPGTARLAVQGGTTEITLGSDLVTNGTFTGSLAGWTAGANWTAVGNAAQCSGTCGTLTQSISVTSGTYYQIDFTETPTITNINDRGLNVAIGAASVSRLVSSPKSITIQALATGSLVFGFTPAVTSYVGTIDTVSVKAISAATVAPLALFHQSGAVSPFEVRTGNASGANIFIGFNAGLRNTPTGTNNSGVGTAALAALTSGSFNSAFGRSSLAANTSGSHNSGFGYAALLTNTIGLDNTAIGSQALRLNTSGLQNTAVGSGALENTTSSFGNTAVGYRTLNALVGDTATQASYQNTAIGALAMENAAGTTVLRNTAVGYAALRNNTGNSNNAFGYQALSSNTGGGVENNAFGAGAMALNTSGYSNSAFGQNALTSNTTGFENVALGYNTLSTLATGFGNIAIGFNAGQNADTSSSGNIFIGNGAGGAGTESDKLYIGTGAGPIIFGNLATTSVGIGTSTLGTFKFRVAGSLKIDHATTEKITNIVWTIPSDGRLKDVRGNYNYGLAAIMQLQPVNYTYKPGNIIGENSTDMHSGFVAQAVQAVIPEAVTMGDDGYLRFTADPILWAMVNAIKEQQAEIVALQAGSMQTQSSTFTTLNATNAVLTNIDSEKITVADLFVTDTLDTAKIKTNLIEAKSQSNLVLKLADKVGTTSLDVINSDGLSVFKVDSLGNVNITGKLTLNDTGVAASVGTGVIVANATEVRIDSTAITADSKVFITGKTNQADAPTFVVSEQGDGYFKVLVNPVKNYELKFDWWVIN